MTTDRPTPVPLSDAEADRGLIVHFLAEHHSPTPEAYEAACSALSVRDKTIQRLRADLASERAEVARLRTGKDRLLTLCAQAQRSAAAPNLSHAEIVRAYEIPPDQVRAALDEAERLAQPLPEVSCSSCGATIRARLADQPSEGGAGDEAQGEDDDFDPIEAVHQLQADRFNCDPPGTAAAERNRIREFNARVDAASADEALIERAARAARSAFCSFSSQTAADRDEMWRNVARAVLAEVGRDTAPPEPGERP